MSITITSAPQRRTTSSGSALSTTSVTRFGHVWATVRDQILAITTARELLKLNDRALKDIGVDRAELERVSLLLPEPFESHPTRLPIR